MYLSGEDPCCRVMQQQPNNNTKGASPLKPHVRNHIKNYPDICTQLKSLKDTVLFWCLFVVASFFNRLRSKGHHSTSSEIPYQILLPSSGKAGLLLAGRRSMSGVYEFKPLKKKKTRVSKVELNLVYRRMLLFASRWSENRAKMCSISRFKSFHGHGLPLSSQEPFKGMSDIDLQ